MPQMFSQITQIRKDVFLLKIRLKHGRFVEAAFYIYEMDLNELTYKIRGVIFEIHNELGPGLFETVYENAMVYELTAIGLKVESQVGLPALYKSIEIRLGFRIDILVDDSIIIEVKSIESLGDIHRKQLLTYLRLSGKKLGILVNFNVPKLIDKISLVRIINN